MKDLIKVIIALAFIAGGFFIGQFKAKEKFLEQVTQLSFELEENQNIILQLKDSLNITISEIYKLKNPQIDTSSKMINDSTKNNQTRSAKPLALAEH